MWLGYREGGGAPWGWCSSNESSGACEGKFFAHEVPVSWGQPDWGAMDRLAKGAYGHGWDLGWGLQTGQTDGQGGGMAVEHLVVLGAPFWGDSARHQRSLLVTGSHPLHTRDVIHPSFQRDAQLLGSCLRAS